MNDTRIGKIHLQCTHQWEDRLAGHPCTWDGLVSVHIAFDDVGDYSDVIWFACPGCGCEYAESVPHSQLIKYPLTLCRYGRFFNCHGDPPCEVHAEGRLTTDDEDE